jgi:hypothetical protein
MEKDASAGVEYLLGLVERSRSDDAHAADNPAVATTAFANRKRKRARRTGGPVRSPEDEEAAAKDRSSTTWPVEAEPG